MGRAADAGIRGMWSIPDAVIAGFADLGWRMAEGKRRLRIGIDSGEEWEESLSKAIAAQTERVAGGQCRSGVFMASDASGEIDR